MRGLAILRSVLYSPRCVCRQKQSQGDDSLQSREREQRIVFRLWTGFGPLERGKGVSLLKMQFYSWTRGEAKAFICYTAVSLTYIIDWAMNTKAHVHVCDHVIKQGSFDRKDYVGILYSQCMTFCACERNTVWLNICAETISWLVDQQKMKQQQFKKKKKLILKRFAASVLYDCNLNICGFWTVNRMLTCAMGQCNGLFPLFLSVL